MLLENSKEIFSRKNRRLMFWLFQFAFWLVHWFIALFAYPDAIYNIIELTDITISILFGLLFSLLLRFIYKRYQVHKYPIWLLITTALIYSTICGFLFLFSGLLVSYAFSGFKHLMLIKDINYLVRFVWSHAYPYYIWSALYFAFKIWEEYNVQKRRAEKEKLLAQNAQIEMLRYQLNPHFLFNTLSSIRALVRFDGVKAEEMITKVSEFLRYSLSYENENEVPLFKEIEIIQNYLDIEKVRFGDKLVINFEIDPLAEDYPIPIFLIHPLIENAIKHGMQTSPRPLRINLKADVEDNELQITVINTGRWLDEDSKIKSDGTRKGLENVRKRLEFSYPGNYSFEIKKQPESVEIKIRFKKELVKRNAKEIQSVNS